MATGSLVAGGGAEEAQRLGHAAAGLGGLAELVHHGVDGVLRHLAVGRELAAGHGDHAVVRGAHGVAAGEVGRALRDVATLVGRCQQRAQAGPHAGDVGPGQLRGGDVVGRVEEVVDVLGRAGRVVERSLVVGVGRAEIDEVGLGPRHDEDGAPVLGDGDDGGDVAGQPIGRHGDVHALGRTDGVRVRALVEGPHVVGPDAGGVDHDPGPDRRTRVAASDGSGRTTAPVGRPCSSAVRRTTGV